MGAPMDPAYLGLLGLAQSFLTANTNSSDGSRSAGIVPAIKCLGAITRYIH